ncbi:ATP-binding protein [Actinoplanes utahensis]|uniref:ATPase n=1 Tax=Actinoplanes utahensis TaxID=1869 RepID=A0A0A6UJW4_ACTUT|nr:ATP-binding protein [Actinoplanes utahensis]KHD74609.1 ATPase [Actinoplanes utahensis]GIF27714.1 hypothetical protein Aut01nite_07000 [Actinoplanes utahensis]
MSIRCETHGDGTNLTATVSGRLTLTDVVSLRDSLLKCLAEQPDALLIDLARLEVDQPLALSVFTVVLRQAARWPGTPVLLCGPTPATRRHLVIGAHQRLPLFAGIAEALAQVHNERITVPSLNEQLLPLSGAPRHARDVATEACLRWDLPDLVGAASLIANELVANVVDHAGTMMTLHLSLRARHLNIAVRDGSPALPVPPVDVNPDSLGGRGLLLINELASAWGCLPSADGKVVWAAIRRP